MRIRLPHRGFAGVQVTTAQPSETIPWIISRSSLTTPIPTDIHLLAGHSLSFLEEHPEFEEVLQAAELIIPDGRWLHILTRKSPAPLHQLRGADLMLEICDLGRNSNLSHFFLGADDESISSVVTALETKFPGIIIAGAQAFPWETFDAESFASFIEPVKLACPSIVWLGISSPRQNIEAHRIAHVLRTTSIAVGAAFDFVSGRKRTAPRWVQKVGLEWIFRFLSEPKRLARRYVFGTVSAGKRLFKYRSTLN